MTISAPVILGGSQQWFNNSGSALSVAGSLYLGLNNTLTFSGGGQTSVSTPITGQGNLVVASGATWSSRLPARSIANSFAGTTQINGGLLKLLGPANSVLLPQFDQRRALQRGHPESQRAQHHHHRPRR